MAKKNNVADWSLALVRVYLGIMFALHGYQKLFVTGGLPGTAMFFSQVGIPYANIAAVVVAFVEFFGGLFLMAGLLTRLAALILVIEMLVAFLKVHLKMGFFISPMVYGYEFILLIMAALLLLVLSGPGTLSLGRKLFKNKNLH